jgi:hypothetical protein
MRFERIRQENRLKKTEEVTAEDNPSVESILGLLTLEKLNSHQPDPTLRVKIQAEGHFVERAFKRGQEWAKVIEYPEKEPEVSPVDRAVTPNGKGLDGRGEAHEDSMIKFIPRWRTHARRRPGLARRVLRRRLRGIRFKSL